MGNETAINWADATFNPWRGCAKVSAGCDNCYAERMAKRNPAVLGTWGHAGTRVIASESYWRGPLKWNRAAEKAGVRRRVFCGSLMDFFETRLHPMRDSLQSHRHRVFDLITATPWLDWLLLTKRPENIETLWPPYEAGVLRGEAVAWPCNVWLGVTVENQAAADARIPVLLQIPAAVKFLSVEPMLGPVDLAVTPCPACNHPGDILEWPCPYCKGRRFGWPDWVIVGGESGPKCRPCNLDWIHSVANQCLAAGVPVWVKQLGGHPNKRERLEDLPGPLRIRELPQ